MALYIGPHLSIADGFAKLGAHALALGANTAAFFTRNPRGGRAKALDDGDLAALRALMEANGFGRLVGHASYTLNAASKEQRVRDYAVQDLRDDLARMERLPGNCYNFHPGSHGGQGIDAGIALVADALNAALDADGTTDVLLETMAGKGSEIGGRFAELGAIIERVVLAGRMGVCMDTCHVWDGGYDIVDDLDGVLTAFDKEVGLARLKAVHLNDSLNERGARKDRHAGIGEGRIGAAAFGRIVNHPALRGLPFILETPQDDAGWAREIEMLRGMYVG